MTKTHRPWYSVLYIQVLIAIAVGVLIGHFWRDVSKALKPLGDGFISLIKMMIAPADQPQMGLQLACALNR